MSGCFWPADQRERQQSAHDPPLPFVVPPGERQLIEGNGQRTYAVSGSLSALWKASHKADDLTSMTVGGRSVVWAEPTLECPFESSIERPQMADGCLWELAPQSCPSPKRAADPTAAFGKH